MRSFWFFLELALCVGPRHPGPFPVVKIFLVVFQVVLVRWNEPYQKLATCDADGGIFVWIQYEGRWSVELVNDRGAQVSGRDPPAGTDRVFGAEGDAFQKQVEEK